MLRIEDIDTARCRPEFIAAILDDLCWLGIDWVALSVQTDHATDHATALNRLRAMGLAYPCTCTRAEIAASASAPQGEAVPLYPGTCRGAALAADEMRPVAWRLDVARAVALAGSLLWRDTEAGLVAADPLAGGDIVLARKGLDVAYHLAVVVDDARAGVTHIVRGADLFAATHVQCLLQAVLGLPTPDYHHHALVAGPDGKRLAKRTPDATLADLRAAGVDPVGLRNDLLDGRLPVGFGWVRP